MKSRHGNSGRLGRCLRAIALCAACMSIAYAAVAAVVSLHAPTQAGGNVEIPVLLYGDPDTGLAGLQFDLHYDASQYELVSVTSGPAASKPGKVVTHSENASGNATVLIIGFNNTEMYDGHVATLTLRPTWAESSPNSIELNNILATDPAGNAMPVDYESLHDYAAQDSESTHEPGGETSEVSEASEPGVESDRQAASGALDSDSVTVPTSTSDPSEPVAADSTATLAPAGKESTPKDPTLAPGQARIPPNEAATQEIESDAATPKSKSTKPASPGRSASSTREVGPSSASGFWAPDAGLQIGTPQSTRASGDTKIRKAALSGRSTGGGPAARNSGAPVQEHLGTRLALVHNIVPGLYVDAASGQGLEAPQESKSRMAFGTGLVSIPIGLLLASAALWMRRQVFPGGFHRAGGNKR
jgi:hypothetical protein